MLRRLRHVTLICTMLALAMGLASRAEAVPITGSIGFSGVVQDGTNFMTTNQIVVPGNLAELECGGLTPCTGAYAVLNGLVTDPTVTYNSFTFNPLPAGGYVPLWTFMQGLNTYSFDLLAISSFVRSATGIVISGSGLARILGPGGWEDTIANWSFSADQTGIFRFSSTTSGTGVPIPEPGSMLLIGTGLFVVAGAARRRFKKA